MNVRNFVYLLLFSLVLASCEKNSLSKIPQITLSSFGPPVAKFNTDTPALEFYLTDGDADLGNGIRSGKYDIFVKDFRYDTGFAGYYFPELDGNVNDPEKGVSGYCTFVFMPYIFMPRTDSIHKANGDTTHFELYIVDRAGHESNHITTQKIILTF